MPRIRKSRSTKVVIDHPEPKSDVRTKTHGRRRVTNIQCRRCGASMSFNTVVNHNCKYKDKDFVMEGELNEVLFHVEDLM